MINYFIGFDKLIGTKLITILYYLGLVGIALGALATIAGGFAAMGYDFFIGLGTILMAIIGAAVGVLVWRFMCELYLLFFRLAEDVRELRNAKTVTTTPPPSL